MRKPIYLLTAAFLVLICSNHVHAQIITTVAGCDDTTLGDGGLATSAYLHGPYDVALDGKGNFYVTDGYNNRIRKVNAAGIITTIAGTGVQGYNGDGIPAITAQIYRPAGIIFDHWGNLYFCDAFNNRVRKIDTNGIITTVAGNGNTAYNGDSIRADSAAIYDPHCVAIDARGTLYITDFENHRIRKVDTAGIITTIAGTGTAGNTGNNGPAVMAEVNGPYGIITDDTGNIYFADTYENIVRKIDTSGIITSFAGGAAGTALGDNGLADSAKIEGPACMVIDVTGNLYFTEIDNQRVRKVSIASNIITTVAGNGTLGFSGDNGLATNAELSEPTGVAIDAIGNIYISDFGNGRIRYVRSTTAINNINSFEDNTFIYPDPSQGVFTINTTSNIRLYNEIIITNAIGEQVKKILLPNTIATNTLITVSLDQPPGMYCLSLVGEHGIVSKMITIVK